MSEESANYNSRGSLADLLLAAAQQIASLKQQLTEARAEAAEAEREKLLLILELQAARNAPK